MRGVDATQRILSLVRSRRIVWLENDALDFGPRFATHGRLFPEIGLIQSLHETHKVKVPIDASVGIAIQRVIRKAAIRQTKAGLVGGLDGKANLQLCGIESGAVPFHDTLPGCFWNEVIGKRVPLALCVKSRMVSQGSRLLPPNIYMMMKGWLACSVARTHAS